MLRKKKRLYFKKVTAKAKGKWNADFADFSRIDQKICVNLREISVHLRSIRSGLAVTQKVKFYREDAKILRKFGRRFLFGLGPVVK